MALFTDQLGRTIMIEYPPERIVSLVPSQTELLASLELEEQVVGITKFCSYPDTWKRSKEIVGGTKNVRIDAVSRLNPDLIIANKEENTQAQIEELAKICPVWVSDVNTLEQALEMIHSLGEITNRLQFARLLVSEITTAFQSMPPVKTSLPAAYLIWQDPYMAAGAGTFINSMLSHSGFFNVFSTLPRYPVITLRDIRQSGCKFVLFSSEPFPFAEKHLELLRSKLPDQHLILVDGAYFSWYGSRMVSAPAYFRKLVTDLV